MNYIEQKPVENRIEIIDVNEDRGEIVNEISMSSGGTVRFVFGRKCKINVEKL